LVEAVMKYQTLDELRPMAEVVPFGAGTGKMSRQERLERWASVLERHERKLTALTRIEYLSPQERTDLRGDDTPLTVAYNDPVLRTEGLTSDRIGDAKAFFELTDDEAHHLLCDCHYRGTMTSTEVAARLRSHANRVAPRGVWSWVYDALTARW
jgi:hypothetical protein